MLCGNWKTIFKHTYLRPSMSSVKYTCMPHTLHPHHATDWGWSAPALKVKAESFRTTTFNDAARNEHNILTAVCIKTGRLQCVLEYQLCCSWVSVQYIKHVLRTHQQCWCGDEPVANFNVLLTVHLSTTRVNDQLDAQLLYFIICLLQSSTCFKQCHAHHQEVKLY